MDLLDEWATKIAVVATPEEADLAPLTVRAYMGAGRSALFEKSTPVGGFAPSGIGQAILPWLLSAIHASTGILMTLLSRAISEVLRYVTNRLLAKPEQVHLVPDDLKRLAEFIRTVKDRLGPLGIPEERCEQISYRVLQALLEEPESASKFVKALGQKS